MTKGIISNILILLSGVVYTFLFWQEGMGLNTFLYSVFLLVTLTLLHPGIWQSPKVIAMGSATVFSALLVVWHHSVLAKFTHITTLILLIGFVQARELRFVWYAFLLGIGSLATGPLGHWQSIKSQKIGTPRFRAFTYWLKLILLPLLVGGLFFLIYYAANAHFAAMMDRIGSSISQLFKWQLSPIQAIMFFLGVAIMMALIWPLQIACFFQGEDKRHPLTLVRKKNPKANFFALNALRQEYWRAKLTIGLLNGLLFVVNVTDLRYVWIEYEMTSAQQLKQYVHEGTYLLILAILMAMLVVVYYFRKNLNFFPENQRLVDLANLWILQNAILVLSVGYRNYQYISQYGLAYKRLAVIFFLLLVLFGLFTLYLKIKHKRALFYLFLLNGWALYATFMLTSAINWDLVITRYNLQDKFKAQIDWYFMGNEMSDKNLFILEKNKERLSESTNWDEESIEGLLKQKRQRFLNRSQKQSWKSWNLPDWRNKRFLEGKN